MVAKKETKTVDIKDIKKEAEVKEATKAEKTSTTAKSQKDELGRAYATGKRKDAIARVWIKAGKGNIEINGQKIEEYFKRAVLRMIINQPFEVANREKMFDVKATVKGGGLSGQAGAVKAGISKALTLFDPELRSELKKAGFLTRDARVVERKKPGKKKARKSFQFSKR